MNEPRPSTRCSAPWLPVLMTPALAGAAPQSALGPAGPQAADLAFIWWLMLGGGIAIFCGVMALVLAGLRRRRPVTPAAGTAFIVGGGVLFPALVLIALLVYTVIVGARVAAPAPRDALTIDVTGHMWWWDVRYGNPQGGGALVTANELRIPVGRPVLLRVHSADVIHSFWVPNLAGKIDMIPGRVNRLTLQADRPGLYRGQCAEFCGQQHARMALHIVAEPLPQWEQWFAGRRQRVVAPAGQSLERGRELFLSTGCAACHAVRGVSSPPEGLGPDLTHVGSRPTLGAGMLPNTIGHLVAWIADSQAIKPGNRMPPFHQLDAASLNLLAEYLHSLQ